MKYDNNEDSFLETIDLYSNDYQLIINSAPDIKSFPGGILTLISIIIFIACLVFKIYNLNQGFRT